MLSEREQLVCDEIERRRDELVALAADLIAFDTTARNVGDPPREEAALQEYLAARLRACGRRDRPLGAGRRAAARQAARAARTRLRRPAAARGARAWHRRRQVAAPQRAHRRRLGASRVEQWTSPPFRAEVRDGRLYGRGACDMKGGIAAMVLATEVLAALGVTLAGDLLVATNTDEESSGAGGTAIVERGIRADAGIVTEPTGFDTWVSCRGSEYGVIRVPGRPGHAEVQQPAWQDGGAVNAIEKATVVIDAIRSLREEWRGRAGLRPPAALAAVAAADHGVGRRVARHLSGRRAS